MIDTKNNVSGELNSNEGLSGSVKLSQTLTGTLEQDDKITGTIKDNQEIKGSISSTGGLTGTTSTKQSLGGNIGTSSTGKVNDVRVNGESVVENKIAYIELKDKADKNWVKEFYYSDDIDKYTWYSYTGIKTLDNIKVPVSGTQTTNIIEGIYRLLDYGLDNLIEYYSYLGYAIHNIQIPKENYIDDIESKQITIDLFNRGKAIIETRPFDDIYTCTKLTLINYLEGWAVKFDENKSELEVLYNTDTSEFIKNTVDNLENYYLKSETYSKEEVDNKVIDLSENVYNKEEVDTKLENLPTQELIGGDNTVIEDNAINVYTNTGYEVSDKDTKLQAITDSGTTGTNIMVYAEDKEIMFIYDKTNKIRKSENGIDFKTIKLPRTCKNMLYNPNNQRLIALSSNGYLIYSDDLGETWTEKYTQYAVGADYIYLYTSASKNCLVVNKTTRTLTALNDKFGNNSQIKSTITPTFMTRLNASQFIWCNNTGTFKYGAGSQEGNFASLSGITVNMLKTVNSKPMIGLKDSNKIFILKVTNIITDNEWVEYTLPSVCTVNDIIYNPYDQTYYIFNDINTYYKTKDFEIFESVDTGLKGIQGYFTLAGIQMTTENHNELFLAPTRTKLENKAQEWDRALDKSRWAGIGLGLDGEQIYIKTAQPNVIGVTNGGIFLIAVDEWHLTEDVVEALYVSKAQILTDFDPNEMDNWWWDYGFPTEDFKAYKIIFNQAGSFWNEATWEEEYAVEQYEYGYIFANGNGDIFKYAKLGNLANLLGGG